MINVRGNLAVRVITGRLGAFRVGKLVSEVGEFAVKSKLIEELEEGAYAGSFTIRKIYPSSFNAGGRITLEVRADLHDMQLDEVLSTPDPILDPAEPDPMEEEMPAAATAVTSSTTQPELAMPEPCGDLNQPDEGINPLASLFGELWPLHNTVKLDPTIGRDTLRKQIVALKELGYFYAPTEQVWIKK